MNVVDERKAPSPEHTEVADLPDGGYGWVCVVAVFFINGFTWGIIAVSYSKALNFLS